MVDTYRISPAATRINVEHVAGDLFDMLVPIFNVDDEPVQVLDADTYLWAVHATIRRNALATGRLYEWSSGLESPNAFIIAGSPAMARLVATPAETAAWQADWPSYRVGWDLDIIEPQQPAGDVDRAPTPYRIATGQFLLTPQFSR